MIFTGIDPDAQIVIPTQEPWPDRPRHLKYDRCLEYMGGLGDVLHRLYTHDDYFRLFRMEPNQRAAVVLMSHNPGVVSLFTHLPEEIDRKVDVFDLGFTTPYHPWEHEAWRHLHGIPRTSICPGGLNQHSLTFFPSQEDHLRLMEIPFERYVVFSCSAGDAARAIPKEIRESIAKALVDNGYGIVVVGNSKYQRERQLDGWPTVLDLTDRLSVPGTIAACRLANGVVTSFSSMMMAAWHERRPVFLLYSQWAKETYVSRGAIGYTFGIDRETTAHGLFSDYSSTMIQKWIWNLIR